MEFFDLVDLISQTFFHCIEKSTFLILLCFVLVPLNDGYRVKRSDDNSVHPLNILTINDDPQEQYDELNHVQDVDDLLDIVTDSVTDDVGVDGSLENNSPDKLCDGSKIFLPNSENCSLFYDCNNKEGSSCPHGMWFDPNYIGDTFCQFPEVICAADNNICDCAEKYPPLPPDPLVEKSVSCLKDNRFHLFSSQVNCGRYFICHNEMKYRMECRQGMHYNAKTEMCDYPEVVNCRVCTLITTKTDYFY